MTRNAIYELLTEDQRTALTAYAAKHGRTWKSKLITAWMIGRDAQDEHAAELRQIRNIIGPRGLKNYTDPYGISVQGKA